MRSKLYETGLTNPPKSSTAQTLGAFLEGYFNRRSDVKPATRINWGHTRRNLLDFFGVDKPLDEINAASAKDFERYLKGTAREHRYAENGKDEPLSPDTVRKRISNAKQFFNDAVDRELIARNPFAKLQSSVKGNKSRQFFVARDAIDKILAVCPDPEWRLLIVLARYGGLRTPSESLSLKWSDIEWDANRMTVHSPKTEHYEGRESRVVPLFPELRRELESVRDDSQAYVVNRWRDAAERTDGGWKNCNLRTHFERIIKRADVTPWPKLWQNLRSTRQTELEQEYPSYVVCAWLGNSERVAKRFYLQVTDEHDARAGGAKIDASHALPMAATSDLDVKKPAENSHVLPFTAVKMGGTGFEPVTSAV
ncbi:MAG: tyrosine-type recombinase/integrase [Pirellulaceae bacterium]